MLPTYQTAAQLRSATTKSETYVVRDPANIELVAVLPPSSTQ